MEGTHFRHSIPVYRHALVLLALLFLSVQVSAQQRSKRSVIGEYAKVVHFGFTLGTNSSTFKYDLAPHFYNQVPDTFQHVHIQRYPGLTLGAVGDLHLGRSFIGEHMDLRFIPSLVLSTRTVEYYIKTSTTPIKKDVESAVVEFPILLKFKSDRFYNFRFYTIGGFKYGYDLASNATATPNSSNPIVAIYPHNYSYEYGFGLDFYFTYFKFSPEVKLSKGINNILVPGSDIFSNSFNRFRSNFVYFSLYFEG